jgi:hypothetical protein
MCIYCNTKHYRKIYENHVGPIPVDEAGKSYDIHHLDGNHSNNNPANLKAVTIQEHYNIHYAQRDYGACYFIAIQRLYATPEEISSIASKIATQRVTNGTHPWTDRVKMKKQNQKRTAEGKNAFSGPANVQKQFADKTHANFIKISCLSCKRVTNKTHFNKWHGDNCKQKN